MNCPNNSTLLIYQLYLQPKKEGNMKKQELYNKVIAYFKKRYLLPKLNFITITHSSC